MTPEDIILSHLRHSGSITDAEASDIYDVHDLSRRIRALRNDGHEIATEVPEACGCPAYGRPVAVYRL